jgi:hypothetical protein
MKKLLALISVALLSSCSFQREPGPAERIGRALDEMRKGIGELAPDESPEERRAREDREWRKRQDDYYRRNSRVEPSSEFDANDTRDSYGETEQQRRDREFWETPPVEDSRERDRY